MEHWEQHACVCVCALELTGTIEWMNEWPVERYKPNGIFKTENLLMDLFTTVT